MLVEKFIYVSMSSVRSGMFPLPLSITCRSYGAYCVIILLFATNISPLWGLTFNYFKAIPKIIHNRLDIYEVINPALLFRLDDW